MQEEQNNPAVEKSYAFALQIVETTQSLQEVQREFVLSRQLLLSGTSIGAAAEEAVASQSATDFLSNMNTAYREAQKTHYWLRLLHDSRHLDTDVFHSLLADCEELLRIIGSICKTSKRRQNP